MADIPPPPDARFGKWAYQLWDYVAKNRLGAAEAINPGTGLVVGTGTGTFTVALGTTGVGAGTYGTGATWPRFSVDAVGRLLTATAGGTLGAFSTLGAIVLAGVVTGTSTTGTLTAAQNFTIGGATSVANVLVTPIVNGTAVACAAGTGTQALIPAYSLPANAMGANRGVRFSAFGNFSSAAIIKSVAMVFGTTPLATGTSTTGGTGNWSMQGVVVTQGANQQSFTCRFDIYDDTAFGKTVIQSGTSGMAVSGAISLGAFKVGTSTTAAAVNQMGLVVEMLN